MTHGGGGHLDRQNANFSMVESRAETPMFFVDILVVYEN